MPLITAIWTLHKSVTDSVVGETSSVVTSKLVTGLVAVFLWGTLPNTTLTNTAFTVVVSGDVTWWVWTSLTWTLLNWDTDGVHHILQVRSDISFWTETTLRTSHRFTEFGHVVVVHWAAIWAWVTTWKIHTTVVTLHWAKSLMSPSGWVSNFVTVGVEGSNGVTKTLTVSSSVTAASLFHTVLVMIFMTVISIVSSASFKVFSSQDDATSVSSPVVSV